MNKELEVAENKFIKVSYGAMVVAIVATFGFGVWMTHMEDKTTANAIGISEVSSNFIQLRDILIKIDKRLSRIETLLERNN